MLASGIKFPGGEKGRWPQLHSRVLHPRIAKKYICNIANPEVLCVCPLLTVFSEQCQCLYGRWWWDHAFGM